MSEQTHAASAALMEREHSVVFQTYRRIPVAIDHAEGARITDVDGRSYLDMLGGIAVNALGHSHPRIIDAVEKQIRRYMHVSNVFYQEPQVRLAEQLSSASGYPRVFFANSGAEATDGALKLARRFGSARGCYDVIGFTGGFHGRTYAALSLMDKPLYKDGMGPFLPNTLVRPFNDVDALESRVDENTCAVMIEFLQGEGGIQSATQEFVDALFALKETYGFLVIADEVQSGIGRTGDFFSFEKYGVRPDIITVAKAMGGGLPLGAILATEEAASLLDKGMHGTTYGGNPVACVAGSVVVEEVCNGLMAHVKEIGDYLNAQLEAVRSEFPEQIREIRGRGCMQGVVVHTDAAPYVQELLKNGVIANATAGNVIRLVPPFIITTADVDELVRALRTVMSVTRG